MDMTRRPFASCSGISRHQRGAVAIGVALSILTLATVIALSVARVTMNEQKTASGESRSREARAMAEAALERGVSYLKQNRRLIRSTAAGGWMQAGAVKWAACAAADISVPCGNGETNQYDNTWVFFRSAPNVTAAGESLIGSMSMHYLAKRMSATSTMPGSTLYVVTGEGRSADDTAQALVSRSLMFYPFLKKTPDSPLIAAGTIAISGAMSIVANPNGGGPGVPLSAWSGGNLSASGSMQSCQVEEYLSTDDGHTTESNNNGDDLVRCPACECPNDINYNLTNSGTENLDVLDVDSGIGVNPDSTNFPDDVFQYAFGVPHTEWETVRDQATVITGCSSLNSSSSGLYWMEGGQCHPGVDVGSLNAPVLLVVSNGEFKMNSNDEFFGMVFAFSHDGGAIQVAINGGPTLYGAILSNVDIDLGNGNYTARYSMEVLENLAEGGPEGASGIAMVPGSWRDY